MSLLIRSAPEPLRLAAAVRKESWAVEKDQPLIEPENLEQLVAASISQPRFTMWLLIVFAFMALILAAVGVYGVMSYAVSQRTHEIGIRIALGGQQREVLRLVLGRALRLILTGVAIGLTAAVALHRLLASQFYGISSTDPFTFLGVSLLLAGVALVASYIPARRAAKVDPVVALRYE
jgi:putative ABC transport system permease protein